MDKQWETIEGYQQSALTFEYIRKSSSPAITSTKTEFGQKERIHNIAYWYSPCQKSSAPTVLFIHGFPSATWDWHQQWQQLAQKHNVLALDLLGFGISDKPSNYAYTLIEQAEIVEALLAYLNICEVHIIAHDYGVSVAQTLLLNAHDVKIAQDTESQRAGCSQTDAISISSICFLNGGLFAESHRPLLTQKLLKSCLGPFLVTLLSKQTLKKSFDKIFAKHSPPSTSEIDMLWQLLCVNDGRVVLPKLLKYIDERAVYRDRWVEAMQAAKCPIGFINGIHDPISGAHMLTQFQKLLPNRPSVGIDCGHYPQLENGALVSKLLLEFLEQGTFIEQGSFIE